MKFTLDWLKDYLDTDASIDEIVAKLNAIGLEVDTVENPAEALAPFTVAEVVDAVKHPDADKLKVCTVSNGSETLQIVCGAPNARKGIKVVLGRPGDYVPGLDVTLKEAKIRGVASSGMMCSAKELELGDDHDGIIELPEDAPVGMSFVEYRKLDNPVVDIEITPNRQDCLGIYGIARDLAAAGLGTLKPLQVPQVAESFKSSVSVAIKDEAASDCSYFMGRAFRGVKNGPSPQWLQDRLTAIGLRPISALVDMTNYITFSFGRPLHVYDAKKLSGNIVVRLAKEGESFDALNDKAYTAKGGEIAITDDSGLIGFGGIVGGESTGCDETTTDVILEAALFDPVKIATTGRQHQLITDARYRFERGVDTQFVADGIELATQMILDLCGGEASDVFSAGTVPSWDKTVSFRSERVKTLGGLDLPTEESLAILARLGFAVEGEGPYTVTVPSWRVDVEGEADIVEEVLRIHGLDNIPSLQLPRTDHKAGSTLSTLQKRARAAKRALASSGLNEAMTWSFMNRDLARYFGGEDDALTVDNPISSELDFMRPSILPNLAEAAQRNRDRGASVVGLFEVGPVYQNDTEKGQLLVAAGVRAGQKSDRSWQGASDPVSVFDAKADALTALAAIGAPVENLQVFSEAPDYYHPGRSGTLRLGPKNILASFGELHPRVMKALDVEGPIVGFEVFLDRVPAAKNKSAAKGAVHISNLQAVQRDFAFLVDQDVAAQDLVRAIRGADKKHIQFVNVFDVYQGKGVPDNQKSLAVSVYLEPDQETFSESDIEAISMKVCAAAEKSVGAQLRS